ncbi:SMI1/KNR4 family protein [Streptomyces sp. NPDC049040]|uniref:SMI1/KNR4 family protein n=1 Tax=Streptomyces sp. NPDC049040 TaxID=3365593 RepID=UPI003722F066
MDERTQWRPFLERWSEEWIAVHDPERDIPLAPEVVADTWLGFAPATEAGLAEAEARLGRRLPPSLRDFLLVTDGWRNAGPFIDRLAGATELEWLRDTPDRSWIEAWEGVAEDFAEDDDEGDEEDGDEADEDEADDDEADEDDDEGVGVREAKVLARSLRLSLEGDAAVMFLDPDDQDDDGEWAAYWLASWSGEGPEWHSSFRDLMHRQWVSFHGLRRPAGATRDHWDAEVERARRDALAGAVDGPLAVFAEAHTFGRARADLLSMQMKAMLGEWRAGIANLMWRGAQDDDPRFGPLFAAEFLPLLVRHEQLAHPHDLRPLPRLKEAAPEPVRALIADHEARAAEPGFRPSFGDPDFDAAVHAVAARLAAHPAFQAPDPPQDPGRAIVVIRHSGNGPAHRPDPLSDPSVLGAAREAACAQAWPDLLAALRLWRPVCEDHIAPISLFADPILAQLITPARGREILATPRGPGRGAPA